MSFLPAVEVPTLDASCLGLHQFSPRKTSRLLALLAAVLPATAPAAVTNYVWDGNFGSGNARLSWANNWGSTTPAPLANQSSGLTNTDLTFAGTSKLNPIVDDVFFIRTLTFAPA